MIYKTLIGLISDESRSYIGVWPEQSFPSRDSRVSPDIGPTLDRQWSDNGPMKGR